MPIKSIQGGYEFGSGLPCIARLRKGAKKEGNRPGKDLNYFRVTMEPGYEHNQSTFELLYGEEPKVFAPVRLGGATVEDVFDYWNRGYTATKLMYKCDGETQVRHFDASTGAYSTDPIACETPTCGCKKTGRLKLFMPRLIEELGVFGYVLLTTTSLHDIRNLLNCFRDIEQMISLHGRNLSDVDFLIGRAPRIISVPLPKPTKPDEIEKFRRNHNGRDWQPGDRMNTTKNLLFIRPTEQYTKRVLLGAVTQERPTLPPITPVAAPALQAPPKAPERRIGGAAKGIPEPTHADYEDDSEDGDIAPEWLDSALKWVKEKFEGFTSQQINDALDMAEGWQGSKNVFKAAIVAAKLNYELTLIDVYTSTNNLGVEVYDAAKKIVFAWREHQGAALEGEVVE